MRDMHYSFKVVDIPMFRAPRFLYIVICLTATSILISGDSLAHASIREDINVLEGELDVLKSQTNAYGNDIVQQKITIKENERLYYDAKEFEKVKRSEVGDSWTSFQEHEDSLSALNSAKNVWDESKLRLQVIIDNRNDVFKKIILVEKEIERLEDLPPDNTVKQGPGELYGISLDQNCLVMIKSNFTSSCPTYDEINLFFPGFDCPLSGIKCLKYHEQKGSGKGYMLNPDHDLRSRIKIIEIRANFDEYLLKGVDGYIAENNTLQFNNPIYTSRGTTFIEADRWFTLLGATIWWLDGGGPDPSVQRFEILNQTEHDITTSYKYQLEKWIEESKEKCKSKCFEY